MVPDSVDLVLVSGVEIISKTNTNSIRKYIVFGKPTLFNNRWNIAHPEIDPYLSEADRPKV